jgi:hypothetical protein
MGCLRSIESGRLLTLRHGKIGCGDRAVTRPGALARGRCRPGCAGRGARRVAGSRLAEPDLEFRAFCARKGLPASPALQLERAWNAWQADGTSAARPASGRVLHVFFTPTAEEIAWARDRTASCRDMGGESRPARITCNWRPGTWGEAGAAGRRGDEIARIGTWRGGQETAPAVLAGLGADREPERWACTAAMARNCAQQHCPVPPGISAVRELQGRVRQASR